MFEINNREEAKRVFGTGLAGIANFVGVTKCSLYQWTEPFNARRRNELLGAAIRGGLFEPVEFNLKNRGAEGMPHESTSTDTDGEVSSADSECPGKLEAGADSDSAKPETVSK